MGGGSREMLHKNSSVAVLEHHDAIKEGDGTVDISRVDQIFHGRPPAAVSMCGVSTTQTDGHCWRVGD